MPLTVDQFVRRLVDAGLFTRTELNDHVAGLNPPPRDGEALARSLVKAEKLTRLQAQRSYAGDGKSLTLGNYLILDKIGAGGMGEVYLAEHRRLGRKVALKVLPAKVTDNEDAVRRFHREVQAVAKLSHPNIVAAFDADEDKGTHYFVMEFVDGADLQSTVKRDGPLPVEKAIHCIQQAAIGLDYAHRQGIVHRDIKPANLLLVSASGMRELPGSAESLDRSESPAGLHPPLASLSIKILDLGLARIDSNAGNVATQTELTNTGAVMGTVDYMAPEQAVNTKNADARSDVYSLGCTLWYLLKGRALYSGETMIQKILAHRDEPIPSLVDEQSRPVSGRTGATRPGSIVALDAVFQKMVAKNPQDRFQSMAAVVGALQACHVVEAVSSTGDTTTGTDQDLRRFLEGIDQPETIAHVEPPPPADVPTEQLPVETMNLPPMGNTFSLGLTKRPKKTLRDHLSDRRVQLWGGAGLSLFVAVIFIAAFSGGEKNGKKPEPDKKPTVAAPASKPPPLAVSPFDEKQAKAHQQAWAKHLGVPVETANSVGMTLRLIPAGEFQMGSSEKQIARFLPHKSPDIDQWTRSETPQHRVRITQPFYLGVHEVTQAQMRQLVGTDASFLSKFGGGKDRVQELDTREFPADSVNSLQAVRFCNELSRLNKLKAYYLVIGKEVLILGGNGYRLPAEEEWEFACRAGTTGDFSFGNNPEDYGQYAWHDENCDNRTHPVGGKRSNAFGLHDIHGNVSERCLLRDIDWTPDDRDAVRKVGLLHQKIFPVCRGGVFYLSPQEARCAVRYVLGANMATGYGFRVARTVNPKEGAAPRVIDKKKQAGELPPSPYTKRPKPVRTIPVAGKMNWGVFAQNAPRALALVGLNAKIRNPQIAPWCSSWFTRSVQADFRSSHFSSAAQFPKMSKKPVNLSGFATSYQ